MSDDERTGVGCLTVTGTALVAISVGMAFGTAWGFALLGAALLLAALAAARRYESGGRRKKF